MLGTHTESIALLLHRNDRSAVVEVTSHSVIPAQDNGFVLGAGRLFSQQDKDRIADILTGTRSTLAFVSDKALARDNSGSNMVWYTPPRMATVRFKQDEYQVPMPLLVYVQTEGQPLRVFAAKGKARPGPTTKLFVAPLGNINTNGTMCAGNVQLGRFQGTEADIAAREAFAVEARNTHLGNTAPVKGATTHELFEAFIAGLHQDKAKVFPTSVLLALRASKGQLTLNDLIQGEV
ncbi:PRTRC system protein B OS=Stutzerimonas stutzeri OX=316 GN=G7024_19865 PE=4 SV=1 [Stutzerimonas stutzeri]